VIDLLIERIIHVDLEIP